MLEGLALMLGGVCCIAWLNMIAVGSVPRRERNKETEQ